MTLTPYSRAEIEAYVSGNLEIVGIRTKAHQAEVMQRFADTIEALPPWQQTILIESRHSNVTGDAETIQRRFDQVTGHSMKVLGFYCPGELSQAFNRAGQYYSEPIHWTDISADTDKLTIRHEEGHRLDYIHGQKRLGGAAYYSSISKSWKTALESEIEHQERLHNPDLQVTPSLAMRIPEFLNRQISRRTINFVPYEGYTKLMAHLAMYKKHEYSNEAFAEMSCHYSSLYEEHRGREKTVDKILSRLYPHLWPVYRDEFIPAAQAHAASLAAARDGLVSRYADAAFALAEKRGEAPDSASIYEKARLSSARGTIARDTDDIQFTIDIYGAPATYYAMVYEDLALERLRMRQTGVSVRGLSSSHREKIRQSAEEMMAEKGVNALVDRAAYLSDALGLLKEFTQGMKKFSADCVIPLSGKEIHDLYEDLGQKGDLGLIRNANALLKGSALEDYFVAFMDYHSDRLAFSGPGETDTLTDETRRFFYENLKTAMLEDDTGKTLEETVAWQTALIQHEAKTLQNYYQSAAQIAELIERPLDLDCIVTMPDILSRFDSLLASEGFKAASRETIRCGRTSAEAIQAYIESREENIWAEMLTGDSPESLRYRTAIGLPYLPAEKREMIGREILEIVRARGPEWLEEETLRLRLDTERRLSDAEQNRASPPPHTHKTRQEGSRAVHESFNKGVFEDSMAGMDAMLEDARPPSPSSSPSPSSPPSGPAASRPSSLRNSRHG